jgi:hypothetical protein
MYIQDKIKHTVMQGRQKKLPQQVASTAESGEGMQRHIEQIKSSHDLSINSSRDLECVCALLIIVEGSFN